MHAINILSQSDFIWYVNLTQEDYRAQFFQSVNVRKLLPKFVAKEQKKK